MLRKLNASFNCNHKYYHYYRYNHLGIVVFTTGTTVPSTGIDSTALVSLLLLLLLEVEEATLLPLRVENG
jgi:uncharacterized membrane protein